MTTTNNTFPVFPHFFGNVNDFPLLIVLTLSFLLILDRPSFIHTHNICTLVFYIWP